MDTFIYFAYGSNMLTERLRMRKRCPSAEPIGVAEAQGYRLVFKKESEDGSSKATLARGEHSDKVYGVLFQINKAELGRLDAEEDPL